MVRASHAAYREAEAAAAQLPALHPLALLVHVQAAICEVECFHDPDHAADKLAAFAKQALREVCLHLFSGVLAFILGTLEAPICAVECSANCRKTESGIGAQGVRI